MKTAIKEERELLYPPDIIKLFVREPKKDKKDLDELQDLVDASGNCDFSTLFQLVITIPSLSRFPVSSTHSV